VQLRDERQLERVREQCRRALVLLGDADERVLVLESPLRLREVAVADRERRVIRPSAGEVVLGRERVGQRADVHRHAVGREEARERLTQHRQIHRLVLGEQRVRARSEVARDVDRLRLAEIAALPAREELVDGREHVELRRFAAREAAKDRGRERGARALLHVIEDVDAPCGHAGSSRAQHS